MQRPCIRPLRIAIKLGSCWIGLRVSLARQSVFAGAAALALAGSRFLLIAILARKLSPTDLGNFAYLQWLVDISVLISSIGATATVSRYAAELRHDGITLAAFLHRWRRYTLALPLLTGAIAVGVAYLASQKLDATTNVAVFAWGFASMSFALKAAYLTGLQRYDLVLLMNLTAGLLLVLGATIVTSIGNQTWMLVAVMICSNVIATLFALRAPYPAKGQIESPQSIAWWRRVVKYSLNMWLVGLLWSLLWSRGEFPIVAAEVGAVGVATYSVALALFGGAVQAVMLGLSAIGPHLSRLWGESRIVEAVSSARAIMDVQLLVCGTAAIALICVGPELLAIVFGPTYRAASPYLLTLSWGLLSLTGASQSHLLQLHFDGRFSRNSAMASVVILYALALTLIPAMGVAGAAVSRAAAMSSLMFFTLFVAARLWGRASISFRNFGVVLLLTASVTMLLVIWPLSSFWLRLSAMCSATALLALLLRYADGANVFQALVRTSWTRSARLRQNFKSSYFSGTWR